MGRNEDYVHRMTKGESIARIGAIWYGSESGTTITNIYYFGNKNMQSLMPIRAESAISFSVSSPPVDTLQMEIIINYSKFRSHLQRLTAQVQISPVLPIQNPVIAAMVQPVQTNKESYAAYGFTEEVNAPEIRDSEDRHALMRMYSSVPVQMKIDNMAIETMPGNPRDVRLVIRMTRVLTATIYGDKVQYIRTMDGALNQHVYVKEIMKESGDSPQVDALASMLGIDAASIRDMIAEMKDPFSVGQDIGSVVYGQIREVLAPDIYRVDTETGESIIVMPYGVECLNSYKKLEMFRMGDMAEDALLSGAFGANVSYITDGLKREFGLSSDSNRDAGAADVTLKIIAKGPIFILDKDVSTQSDILVHFCIITHAVLADVGNSLIASGYGFESPVYDPDLVPPDYHPSRVEASIEGEALMNNQLSGMSSTPWTITPGSKTINDGWEAPAVSARALVVMKDERNPWETRSELRRKLGDPSRTTAMSTSEQYIAVVNNITNAGTVVATKVDGSVVNLVFQCVKLPTVDEFYWSETIDMLRSRMQVNKPIYVEEVPSFPNDPLPPSVTSAIMYSTGTRSGVNSSVNAYMLQEGYGKFKMSRGSRHYGEAWYKFSLNANRADKGLWQYSKTEITQVWDPKKL